jgi:lipoprotein-releasing system permease protein
VDYRLELAGAMLAAKKGSLIGAILAMTIGILVIHVNFVIYDGLYDGVLRDLTTLLFGDIYVSNEESYIDKTDSTLVSWFERIPYVDGATPRLAWEGHINASRHGVKYEEYKIRLIGVDPISDPRASKAYEKVVDGQFVYARNSMVLGETVARDLGYVEVGDEVKLKVKNRYDQDQLRRFTVVGISSTPGGQGLDNIATIHIDTLREMTDRPGESTSILVKVNDPTKLEEIRTLFYRAFPTEDFEVETVEEAAESELRAFRSGISLINVIGYFGMTSSSFGIVTIMMMLVSSKTREIGVLRAIGAKRNDILVIFLTQGIIIGILGAAVGTTLGLLYGFYADVTDMSFNDSIVLEVSYNWPKIGNTALMAFIFAVVAALGPSYKATKLSPVEAMKSV